jgi:cyclopropane-fatty-acyl-phospholipid synthase
MFEHVGVPSYDTYFQTCRRLLKEDGVMLLHTIGRTGTPYPTNPWITRYIFPGGHLPTLSEMMPAIERAGLVVTDVEILRLYDERFCRMWECYLAMSETAFRFQDAVVFQVQLARRNDVVPLTRDYIAEREAALKLAESVDLKQSARTEQSVENRSKKKEHRDESQLVRPAARRAAGSSPACQWTVNQG